MLPTGKLDCTFLAGTPEAATKNIKHLLSSNIAILSHLLILSMNVRKLAE